MYLKKVYYAGATIDTYNLMSYKIKKRGIRAKKSNSTPEDVQAQNDLLALDKIIRIINANFTSDDFHLVLPFRIDRRPKTEVEFKKIFNTLIRKARKEYRACGKELKWFSTYGYLPKGGVTDEMKSLTRGVHAETAPHFHLIVNGADYRIWTKLWKYYGRAMLFPLDDRGEYSGLARYFFEHTKNNFREYSSPTKQRYSHSRNLIIPKPNRKKIKADSWSNTPKPKEGYYIDTDSIRMGVSAVTGYPYMFYRQIKVNPRE